MANSTAVRPSGTDNHAVQQLRERLAKEMYWLYARPTDERRGRVAGVADALAELDSALTVTEELLAAVDAAHAACRASGIECGCGRARCSLVPLPMLGVSHAHASHLHGQGTPAAGPARPAPGRRELGPASRRGGAADVRGRAGGSGCRQYPATGT